MRPAAICLVWLGTLAGAPASAQIAPPAPPGPYVIDVRGATIAIPQDPAFFPPVPTGTIIPTRGYGVDVGAHLYLIRLGPGRLGIGASVLRVRGTALPAQPTSRSTSGSTPTTTVPATRPDVDATLAIFAPQLSFNFGSADGWSYVSAGAGNAWVSTGTSAFGGPGSRVTLRPASKIESETLSSVNFGGGARWFAKSRLAFSFDVRFHLLSAAGGSDTSPATPGTKLMSASAGLSLR